MAMTKPNRNAQWHTCLLISKNSVRAFLKAITITMGKAAVTNAKRQHEVATDFPTYHLPFPFCNLLLWFHFYFIANGSFFFYIINKIWFLKDRNDCFRNYYSIYKLGTYWTSLNVFQSQLVHHIKIISLLKSVSEVENRFPNSRNCKIIQSNNFAF